MNRIGPIQRVLILLAIVGLCVPQPVLAAAAASDLTPKMVDVALTADGALVGQVIDLQGVPLRGVPVALHDQTGVVSTTLTDQGGYFTVPRLRGGAFQVVAAGSLGAYRLWAPGTAPPTAQRGVLLIAGENTTRGQCCPESWLCCMANPWLIAGIVATAIAVPVAIHNGNRDSPISP